MRRQRHAAAPALPGPEEGRRGHLFGRCRFKGYSEGLGVIG